MSEGKIDDPNTNRGLQAAIIAEQNDALRRCVCARMPPINEGPIPDGKSVFTRAVFAEGPEFVLAASREIALYDDFTSDNDPHGWHEFGVIEVQGKRVWWKIDVYDTNYEYGSEVPHDLEQTRRVLTILFPADY